ncbi:MULTISPECIES: hypothetical protein [unclassified Halobacillus]|uniref:hypothetical protein n=1 Tax=unclassified Halobacillus TaxID=2636472 RepID=UPI0002A4E3D9|nr:MULTISPECIES: hypothetical protein [unclassified Halobacillus]ELK46506.1 hypothetical protein D479_10246 [Halobacillus sp. BAB-2008]
MSIRWTRSRVFAMFTAVTVIGIGGLIGWDIRASHMEVEGLVNACYDAGGLPRIEKSGLSVTFFECE